MLHRRKKQVRNKFGPYAGKGSGYPEFATWRDAHDLRDNAAGQKRLTHPRNGALQCW
jgi:hypothetical protein